tara:strand:+ start:832 stop:1158 length:327 start_codon:yes stop_codon:yes gene_type:complete
MPAAKKKSLSSKEERLLDTLVKNNVALQKASLDIVKSNNELSKRIDNLISLFEEASTHITASGTEDDIRALAARLDSLIEQNKDLAKGLVLLEEYVRSKQAAANPLTL